MRVAIIGCGKMGWRRAEVLTDFGDQLVACYDHDGDRTDLLAQSYNAAGYTNVPRMLTDSGAQAIVVCTPHDMLAHYGGAVVATSLPMLLEKPGGLPQHWPIRPPDVVTRVGYTLRFHPAAQALWRALRSGEHGPLLWIRAHYGHGGRDGYEQEWRCDRKRSGGGELIDQGSHLIDLCRWYVNANLEQDQTRRTVEFDRVGAVCETFVWGEDVEDNAFVTMSTPSKQIAMLHASWTEWCPSFSFEVCTDRTLFVWRGLGGVYGTETLTEYRDRGRGVRSTLEFPNPDTCWRDEWMAFHFAAVGGVHGESATLDDAAAVMRVIEEAYVRSGLITYRGQVTGDAPQVPCPLCGTLCASREEIATTHRCPK